jgi:hypothetical protein
MAEFNDNKLIRKVYLGLWAASFRNQFLVG